MIRQTHTYVTLEVSDDAFKEIFDKLSLAGYHHCLVTDQGTSGIRIDMQGIALVPTPPKPHNFYANGD